MREQHLRVQLRCIRRAALAQRRRRQAQRLTDGLGVGECLYRRRPGVCAVCRLAVIRGGHQKFTDTVELLSSGCVFSAGFLPLMSAAKAVSASPFEKV